MAISRKNIGIKPILVAGLSVFLLLTTPKQVSAEWYWLTIPEDPAIGEFTELSAIEYAVTQIPKDQLQAIDETLFEVTDLTKDSENCSSKYSLSAIVEELRKYDAEHDFYTVTETVKQGDIKQGYTYIEISTTTNQSTINGREQLIDSIVIKANNCLDKEKEEQEKIEREERIIEALANCDIDFFENEMTNDERMATWNERQACKEVPEPVAVEPEPVEVVGSTPTPTPPPIVPQQSISIPEPAQTTHTEPVINIPETVTPQEVAEVAPTSSAKASTEEDTAGNTIQEEPPALAETVEKPSLFKRIANFFTKLFFW